MGETNTKLPKFLNAVQRASLRDLFHHDVTIRSCLYWRNRAPWGVAWRTCGDTFLLFPVDGRVRVQLKNRSFLISPGTFLILPEQTPHSLELIKGHKHLHQIALHFHLQDRWKRSLLSRYPAVSGKLNDPEETMRALSELTCLLGHDRETGQAFGTALVQCLLASQLRKHALTSENLPKGDQRISRALQRMERELSSPNLSVEELAYSVGLSPVQFRKLFLRDMREGPKQFLQGLRMRHALRLLRHTDAAVKDVAAQCGFASDHYFHLAFHQKHGQTPSQYRSGPQEI